MNLFVFQLFLQGGDALLIPGEHDAVDQQIEEKHRESENGEEKSQRHAGTKSKLSVRIDNDRMDGVPPSNRHEGKRYA